MRDGSEVEDARLGRLVQFDERSRNFPVREVLAEPAYRSASWDVGEWLDQGTEGACVGFAWTHELIAIPIPIGGLDNQWAREIIYWEAQRIDPWPGGAYPGASPFYEGTSVLAGVKVCANLGFINEYRWAFGLDDVRLTLGNFGPLVLGLNWYEGMFDTDQSGFITPTGRNAGGHAILAVSVNEEERWVRLHNSWGKSWGIDGTCRIRFDDLDRLLREQGEACVPVIRSDPSQPEPEPEEEPAKPRPFGCLAPAVALSSIALAIAVLRSRSSGTLRSRR